MLTKSLGLIAPSSDQRISPMDLSEYTLKLDELDHLLNDPDVKLEPDRVWMLLAELSRHEQQRAVQRRPS